MIETKSDAPCNSDSTSTISYSDGHHPVQGSSPEQSRVFARFEQQAEEWHAQMTQRLLRKIDLRLLPILTLFYVCNFLDRSNLSQARLGTLERDLGMDPKSTQFNTATSIFFVGYILMQLPSNLIITRTKPSIYLGCVMIVWGTISTAQAATHSFGGLVAARFLLGFAEAPFFPGALLLMSSWYTRKELSVRFAWFYAGTSLANAFGGLIAAGVLDNLNGAHGLSGWRYLFIIEGVITIAIAICSVFIMPNFPADTRWLAEEQRDYACWRLAVDAHEADDPQSSTLWSGVKAAFTDYRLYICILLQHTSVLAQNFQLFFPSIVDTLGFGRIETLLLTVPVWMFTFACSVFVTWTAGRTGDRSIHIISLSLLSMVGNIITVATTSTGGRYFGMYLIAAGAISAYPIILAWIAGTFGRPLVKRSVALAASNMIGNAASIYGSYMWPSSQAPKYVPGLAANTVICLLLAGVALTLRFCLARENKALARAESIAHDEQRPRNPEVETKGFRYTL